MSNKTNLTAGEIIVIFVASVIIINLSFIGLLTVLSWITK